MPIQSIPTGVGAAQPNVGAGANAPAGQLAGHQVQVGQPAAPRANLPAQPQVGGGGGNGSAPPSLFSRLFGTSPNAALARADRKVREGQVALDKQVGKMFTALGSGKAASTELVKLANQMEGAAQPATRNGMPFKDLLSAVVVAKLSVLDGVELQEMRSALDQLPPASFAQSPALHALKAAVDQHAIDRERDVMDKVYADLQPSLDYAMALVTQQVLNSADCTKTFSMLRELASDALASTGYGKLPPAQFEKMVNTVLLQAIDMHVDPEAPTLQQQKTAAALTSFILQGVSSEDMRTLLMTEERMAGEDPGASRNLLMGAVTTRADQLETAVIHQVATAGGSPRQLSSVASDLKQAMQSLKEARHHADVNHLHMTKQPQIDQQIKQFAASMQTLTRAEVAQLSRHELVDLLATMRELGIEKLKGPLADALREATLGKFALNAMPVMNALARGDMATGLRELAQLTQAAINEAEMLLDGGDALMELREQLMSSVLELMPPEDFKAMARLVQTPQFSDLVNDLASFGNRMMVDEEMFAPGAGKVIFDNSIELRMLKKCAQDKVNRDGVQIGTGLPKVFPSAASTIALAHGVIEGSDGFPLQIPVQDVGANNVAKLEKELDELVTQQSLKPIKPGFSHITAPFADDVDRARYSWSDGVQTHDLSAHADPFDFATYSANRREDSAVHRDADQNLLQLTQGDATKAKNLARIFHQGLFAGMEKLCVSDQSPYRLSDGRIVALSTFSEANHLHAEPDGNGGFLVSATSLRSGLSEVYETDPHEGFQMPDSKRSVGLNPDTSFVRMTAHFHMNANGDVIVGTPAVTAQVSLQPL